MRSLLAAFVAVLSLLLAAVPVGATGDAYRADVTPGEANAGATPTFVVTIKQLSSASDQKVKSAQVRAPNGFVIDTDTVMVKRGNNRLNNLSKNSGSVTVNSIPSLGSGDTITVSMKAFVRCGTYGDADWTVIARNGGTFTSGGADLSQKPDSDLTVDVTECRLAFKTQPKVAQNGRIITSVPADPSGEAIKVELLTAGGASVSQSGVQVTLDIFSGPSDDLSGLTQVETNGNGVASFYDPTPDPRGPRISTTGRDYRLFATADGIKDSAESGPFDIEDVAKACGSSGCGGTTPKVNGTQAVIDVGTSGIIRASLGLEPILDCNDPENDFYEETSEVVTWDFSSQNGRTVITIRLDASKVDRPYNLYDVCFEAPPSYGFRNRYNVRIEPGEAGLLKICPPRLDKQNADPCVLDKWRENGDVLIKFSVPPGDPRGRI